MDWEHIILFPCRGSRPSLYSSIPTRERERERERERDELSQEIDKKAFEDRMVIISFM
jgi:hypothetical protein